MNLKNQQAKWDLFLNQVRPEIRFLHFLCILFLATEPKRGRPTNIPPQGRHPVCRECEQLIYYKSDEKYLHGTCYFHKSCYDKW